ncbi:MAG TPA: FAD-dependent oxidoreductase [Roseiflexaceae bacterium]|nr:FAD-dependent oxidoreductase [Roseiflexaceae bacterium]
MQLYERPVWSEGVAFPTPDPARPLPERADVAVVGGGITGLAAALALARRGASVAVLEARAFGWGAGARNGGMVLTGLKLGVAALVARYGREAARRMFAASLAAVDAVEQLVAEERIECHFARCGHLVVASKPSHAQALAREAEALAREFGHPTRFVPRAELRAEIGSDAYYGGLVDEASAGLHPARYLAGLAHAAARTGAHLAAETPVQRIERDGTAFCVHTARGALRASAVLVATAGYTGPATPALRRHVVPVGSYIIATEPLPEALAGELIPRGRMIYDTKHFLHYFRLTPDGRMLFGGRAGFVPETPASVRESAEILRRDMARVFPQLREARVAYAWGGTLDFTFDLLPHTGQVDGIHVALGYAGHGVALATYLGTRAGAQLAGEPVGHPFERPLPGAPLGLYRGDPWFLPLAGAWYRLLDWVS